MGGKEKVRKVRRKEGTWNFGEVGKEGGENGDDVIDLFQL